MAGPAEKYAFHILREHQEASTAGPDYPRSFVDLANNTASPALRALGAYAEMMDPTHVSWQALRLTVPFEGNVLAKVFQCLYRVASGVWRRLVLPYRTFPFSLAGIIDERHSVEMRHRIAEGLLQACPACRDSGLSAPLADRFRTAASLQTDGKPVLEAAFTARTTTLELENAFARATSMRTYLRGMLQSQSTAASKHVLAEVKTYHGKCLSAAQRSSPGIPGPVCSPEVLLDAPAGGGEDCHAALMPIDDQPDPPRKRRKGNTGWTVFVGETMAHGASQAGESKEERRRRLWSEASQSWCRLTEVQKLHYAQRAVYENRKARGDAVLAAHLPPPLWAARSDFRSGADTVGHRRC